MTKYMLDFINSLSNDQKDEVLQLLRATKRAPSEDKVKKCHICLEPKDEPNEDCYLSHPDPTPKPVRKIEKIETGFGYDNVNKIVMSDKINELIDAVEELRRGK